MGEPTCWSAEAFNQVPHSENEIHGNEVAKKHGFEGGLVPGVTVSAYIIHPAVVAWGAAFLERGKAEIGVQKPLYDRRAFTVDLTAGEGDSYQAVLTDDTGVACAQGAVSLPAEPAEPPTLRGDRRAPKPGERKRATRQEMERLREVGMGTVSSPWNNDTPMRTYLRDAAQMPVLLQPEAGAFANASFGLGMTNWALSANAHLGPWLHLHTTSQNLAPIPMGSDVILESAIADLFEKKGHEFVDLACQAYLRDGTPVMEARLRAIYQLAGK